MLDQTDRRERARLALRRHRERVRNHEAMYRVTINAAVIDMLVAHGYVGDDETNDTLEMAKGISLFLAEVAAQDE